MPLANTYITKPNKNGVFTNVSFKSGLIEYFKGSTTAYRQDHCDKGAREWTNRPESPRSAYPPTLDGIKAKCFSEWPGDYPDAEVLHEPADRSL